MRTVFATEPSPVDFPYLLLIAVLAALTGGLVRLCDRLGRR
jgi:hypothetical protein